MRKPLKTNKNVKQLPLADKTTSVRSLRNSSLKETVSNVKNKDTIKNTDAKNRAPRNRKLNLKTRENEILSSITNTPTVVSTKIRSRNKKSIDNKNISPKSNVIKSNSRKSTRNLSNSKTSNVSQNENQPIVLVERNTIVENVITRKLKKVEKSPTKRYSNPLAVYEFEFDPNEEPKHLPKAKKKRVRQRKQKSKFSDNEYNPTKPVVKTLRKKLDRKVKNKPIINVSEEINNTSIIDGTSVQKNKKTSDIACKSIKKRPVINILSVVTSNNINSPKQIPEIHAKHENKQNPDVEVQKNKKTPGIACKSVEKQSVINNLPVSTNDGTNSSNQISDIHVEHINDNEHSSDVEIIQDNEENLPMADPQVAMQNEIEDIAKSFAEDSSDEDHSEATISTPSRVEIITNLVSRKQYKPECVIFNSTMNPSPIRTPISRANPWRPDFSTIRKNTEWFSVKNKSFTPSYDPGIADVASSIKKPTDKINVNKENVTSVSITHEKPKKQQSILSFVNSSKSNVEIINQNVSLFEDFPVPTRRSNSSPRRKILGTLNCNNYSTPVQNVVNVSEKNNRSSDESLFGFSFLSDDENKENISVRKSPRKQKHGITNVPSRIPAQENKKVTISDKPIQVIPEPVIESETSVDVSAAATEQDINNLFQEPATVEPTPKRYSRSYVRKNPKRKRIPSLTISNPSEDEDSDVELSHHIKKKRDTKTKEEEAEAKRLALHYNSMFEEVDKHVLCIE